MSDDKHEQASDAGGELELRKARKFTQQEAIARLAGPGAMKGASPVTRQEQAQNEIWSWLRSQLDDPVGALQVVLHRQLKGSELLLKNVDQPLIALAAHFESLLSCGLLMKELVREADVEWARMMGERAFFETAAKPPNPDDPYTLRSVSETINEALKHVTGSASR